MHRILGTVVLVVGLGCAKSDDTASQADTGDGAGLDGSDGTDGTGGTDGTTASEDADGDGFSVEEGDCDDEDETRYPFDRTASGGDAGCGHRVALGSDFLCGLQSGGELFCADVTPLGESLDVGQTNPPDGSFVQVSAGSYHACARGAEGEVACWGWDLYGQSSSPDGRFQTVDAGGYLSCGLDLEGAAACWGGYNAGTTPAPEGTFSAISAGAYSACGVRSDGSLACWAPEGIEITDPPSGTNFVDVSVGSLSLACGLTTDGGVACWGDSAAALGSLPTERVERLDVSFDNGLCIQGDAGGVACYGPLNVGSTDPVQQMDAEMGRVCTVGSSGAIACATGE